MSPAVWQAVLNFNGSGLCTTTGTIPSDRHTHAVCNHSCIQFHHALVGDRQGPSYTSAITVLAVHNTHRAWILQTCEEVSLSTPLFTGIILLPAVSSIYGYQILHCADTQCEIEHNGKTSPLENNRLSHSECGAVSGPTDLFEQ